VSTTEDGPGLRRAKELYIRGLGQFETANYDAAISLWTEAYTTLPDDPDNARTKALLIYNVARAQEQAYNVDRDIAHLRQARILMDNYAQKIPHLYEDDAAAETERMKVRERLAALDEAIAEVEQSDPAAPVEGRDLGPPSEPQVEHGPGEDAGDRHVRGKVLVGVGAGLVALGGAGFGVMIAGLVRGAGANGIDDLEPDDIEARRRRFDRGRAGNAMAIGGGVIGGALVVSGTVLLVLGKQRDRGRMAWSPVVGNGVAGLQWNGRF
jgi:tetratricopeptide (TPR) repeat protein